LSRQITNTHLAFMQEAKDEFELNPLLETYTNTEETMIALRYGMDRDCILISELGDSIANFVQQIKPQPKPREEIYEFAYEMNQQLLVNEHKGTWKLEHWEFLKRELNRNSHSLAVELFKEDHDKDEITRRAANTANFAMMIADNYGKTGGQDHE
jgi:hypothetical protein